MSTPDSLLDALRDQIDQIDRQLHDLIMRRAEIVRRIGDAKGPETGAASFYRPGREAMVVRRLLGRHQGEFPRSELVRVWREIMGALLRLQGPFKVAVYMPAEHAGYWDIARDHFGSHAPMTACRSAGQVVRDVAAGHATVGVLSFPREGEDESWWPLLMPEDQRSPRVCGRLPFAGRGNARDEGLDAAVIACLPLEATGQDRTLVALETAEISRSRLFGALGAAGLEPRLLTGAPRGDGEGSLNLVEVDGFIGTDDPRFETLRQEIGATLRHVVRLGAYAVPFDDGQLV